jgi:hypothetical protein
MRVYQFHHPRMANSIIPQPHGRVVKWGRRVFENRECSGVHSTQRDAETLPSRLAPRPHASSTKPPCRSPSTIHARTPKHASPSTPKPSSCMGIEVGCWRVWSRWDGCLWCGWRRGCVREFAIQRVQALGCVAAYGWALGARYRVEQVFGSVKGVYGSYVGCRCWGYARVWVWGMLVLWNLVQWLRVGGDRGDCLCVVFVVWGD